MAVVNYLFTDIILELQYAICQPHKNINSFLEIVNKAMFLPLNKFNFNNISYAASFEQYIVVWLYSN